MLSAAYEVVENYWTLQFDLWVILNRIMLTIIQLNEPLENSSTYISIKIKLYVSFKAFQALLIAPFKRDTSKKKKH